MERWRRRLEPLLRGAKLEPLREAGRQFPLSCCLLLGMLGATVAMTRFLPVFLAFWSLLAGFCSFYVSLSPDALLPSVLPARPRTQRQEAELFPRGRSCAVCGKNRCRRHRPSLLLENQQPWLDLKVPSKVDAAVAEVFELVLEKFVYPWYRDISEDEACLDEVRMTFRFFASVLIRRAQKVDIPSVFADKVLKAVLKHVEVLAKAAARARNVEDLQRAALQEYGAGLHAALRGRRDELQYLRRLTEGLFPFLMPPRATDCRSLALLLREVMAGSVILPTMDFMADPDTVNLMVLLFLDDAPPEPASEPPSPLVPFLEKFTSVGSRRPSVLKLELKEIREQQDLLFRFLNFLKQEGAVNLLQFCLAAEEFNDRILRPELSDAELRRLHGELLHIHQTYCQERSVDNIRFLPGVAEQIGTMAAAPYQDVVRLQKTPCLFQAYEHVLSLLEDVFTPMFCHSDEYFRHLLKGAESPTRNSRINRNPSRRGESFGISRIGSRIKGVFRSTTMDGALLPPSSASDMEDDTVEEATVVMEDDLPAEPAAALNQRDLSAWSVSMPFIDFYEDEAKREKIPVFCIDVKRNDRKSGHEPESWSVYRRYLEFYVLESRLTEFHGAFADAQLPSKRLIGPKNYEFLESKREEFEEYLRRLLQHPELSNSQLLADFLSPFSLESQFLDKMLPDVNLGKIFKSVPGKLMKEKGQNLEPFLQSFFNSCESPRPKPSRPELVVFSPSAENNKKLFNELYGNNADLADFPERKHNSNCFLETMAVDGVYDSVMFVAREVFRVSDWLHHLLAAGRILLRNSLDVYMERHLQAKLEEVLQEHRLLSLITQLRDAVFCENHQQRSVEEKQLRAQRTLEEMMSYLPDTVVKILGEDSRRSGVELLFQGLQQPLLNKQMSYVLLDVAVSQLFPELLQEPREAFIV